MYCQVNSIVDDDSGFQLLLMLIFRMAVSNFARDMLSKIQNDPVFSVSSSHNVYKKVGSMAQIKVSGHCEISVGGCGGSRECLGF